jgi:ankyrin repeat domain-containing protein 50
VGHHFSVPPGKIKLTELACLRSLCFHEMELRQQSIYFGLDRTCEWFFERPEFGSWVDIESEAGNPRLLWIKGKPGAGKSTLMKTTLRYINQKESMPQSAKLAFFFNGLGTGLDKNSLGFFRSLLYQLLQQHRSLIPGFLHLYRQKIDMHGPNWEWQRPELEEYFFRVVTEARASPLFIIIDALDECEEASARELITFFEDLTSSSYPNQPPVRICVSSRYYPYIYGERWTEVHMDEHNEPDIRLYVERRLRFDSKISKFMRLVTEIVRKAAGVFLWVVLVVKSLVKAMDEGEPLSRLEQIIDDVPEQLNDLIRQLIDSITDEHRLYALRIMQLVLFASKPLCILELRFALAFGGDLAYPSQAEAKTSATFIETDSQMEKLIRSRTRGLVEVKTNFRNGIHRAQDDNPESVKIVQFIHESVKYVLLHHGGLQILDSNLQSLALVQSQYYIARTCVAYLNISELQNLYNPCNEPETLGSIQASQTLGKLRKSYPFLEYAVKGIFHHAKRAESSCQQYSGLSTSLMIDMQRKFDLWRYLNDLDLKGTFHEVHGPYAKFAHVAVEYNMIDWVLTMIQQNLDINLSGGRFHTLIQTAAAMGHEELVEILLENGADINLSGGRHEHLLTAAAFYGNEKILKLLLERKPNVNALGGEYYTALQAAAASLTGDEKIVQLLLDAKADIDIRGGRHGNALQAAAFKGNEDIVRLLLDAGANVNAEGGEHGSALQAASFQGHEGIVRILLANGADVHIEAGNYGTALWAAAYSGHVNVVQLLLDLDTGPADNIASTEKRSPATSDLAHPELQNLMDAANAAKRYHDAVNRGDAAGIQALLDVGVDVNVRGGDLSSAWHLAACDGRSDVLCLLLTQSNPRPDIRDAQNRTALWYAAAEGHEECVRQLSNSGLVDYSAKSNSGRNLLWYPCWNGHLEIVRLLLMNGVNPHEVDFEGVSPLMAARRRDQLVIVNLLR